MAQFLLDHLVADVLVFGDQAAADQASYFCFAEDAKKGKPACFFRVRFPFA